MAKKRLQNTIAESRYALPCTALYALLVWASALYLKQQAGLLPVALMGVSTYLMVELNNQNALMRIYSRMVSCSFLVLGTAGIYLLHDYVAGMVQLCTIVCYLALFRAYQDKQASGAVFTAFLAIGVAAVFFIQILFFVPILWLLLATRIMGLSIRTFSASLLGILTPFWFAEGCYIAVGKPMIPILHIENIARFASPCTLVPGDHTYEMALFALLVLCTLTGTVHFLRTTYKDKIRTRMLYETLITLSACCLVFIIVQPQHARYLLPMLMVSCAPLIAHYITFTRTWLTNILFMLLVLGALLLTLFALWML